VDLFTISDILGHSTVETTKRYLHLVQDHKAAAINRGSLVIEETGKDFQNHSGTKSGTNVADPRVEHLEANEGKYS
jgi:hypothetical protein